MTASRQVPAGCYVEHSGFIQSSSQTPCGDTSAGLQLCCQGGDICLESSICHFSHPLAKTSGYYIGGCTDPSFTDPSCARQCCKLIWRHWVLAVSSSPFHADSAPSAAYGTQDIVFNRKTDLWACCYGLGTLDCAVPNNETLQAPAPENLRSFSTFTSTSQTSSSSASISISAAVSTVTVLPSRASSSSASNSSKPSAFLKTSAGLPGASSSSPSAASSTPSLCADGRRCSSGLSEGAKAGLGVGVSLFCLALIVGIVLASRLLRRRKRSSNVGKGPIEKSTGQYTTTKHAHAAQEPGAEEHAELDGKSQAELDSSMRFETYG